MTNEELSALIYETLADTVAQRVAEKLIARQKKALVVYTGSTMGFQPALEELAKLRADGFTFTVFLSQSAAQLLDVSKIKAALTPDEILVGDTPVPPEQFAAPFPTIIVPAMTVNTAAHVSACLADTPAARLITNSMWRGKNVVISIDGCCPDHEARAAKGYRMTPPLKAQLRKNLELMRDYGAKLSSADRLCEKTRKAISQVWASAPAAAKPGPASQPAVTHSTGKVLGRGDIVQCAPGSTLRVKKGTLITQLARDAARIRDVAILTE